MVPAPDDFSLYLGALGPVDSEEEALARASFGGSNSSKSGSARFPHGESIDDALMRYVSGLQRLVSRTERVTLVVLHEFALRRIAAAAVEAECFPFSDGDIANGVPYLFDDLAIERAADRLERESDPQPAEESGCPEKRGAPDSVR